MNTTANTFYVDHDGSVVCHHRDISCCPECATHPEIVEVYGVHYHVPDAAERAELLADIARTVLPEVK